MVFMIAIDPKKMQARIYQSTVGLPQKLIHTSTHEPEVSKLKDYIAIRMLSLLDSELGGLSITMSVTQKKNTLDSQVLNHSPSTFAISSRFQGV